jgi:WD40 repeat protein
VLRSFPVRLNNPGRSDRLIVAPYAFAPSGQLLIAVRDQGPTNGASQTNHRMGLVDVARGELVAQASLAGGEVDAVAWSSKGKLLAVGTTDGTLLLYDARTLKLIGQPAAAQAGSVDAVSFSPDDRTIITSGTDAAMNVWNVATLTQEGPSITFPHAAGYWFAWYAPNGDVTGLAPTGTVHDESLSQPFVFPGRASEWLRQACALAGSDFTPAQWAQYVGDRPYQHVCQP